MGPVGKDTPALLDRVPFLFFYPGKLPESARQRADFLGEKTAGDLLGGGGLRGLDRVLVIEKSQVTFVKQRTGADEQSMSYQQLTQAVAWTLLLCTTQLLPCVPSTAREGRRKGWQVASQGHEKNK